MRYILFSPKVSTIIEENGGLDSLPQLPSNDFKYNPCTPENFAIMVGVHKAPVLYFALGENGTQFVLDLKKKKPNIELEPNIINIENFEELSVSLSGFIQDNLMDEVNSVISDLFSEIDDSKSFDDIFSAPEEIKQEVEALRTTIENQVNTIKSLKESQATLEKTHEIELESKIKLINEFKAKIDILKTSKEELEERLIDLEKNRESSVVFTLDFEQFDIMNPVHIIAIDNVKAYGNFVRDIGITQDCIILDTTEYSVLDILYKYNNVIKTKKSFMDKLISREIGITAGTIRDNLIDKGHIKILGGIYREVTESDYFGVDWAKLLSDLSKMGRVYVVCDLCRQESMILEFVKNFEVLYYTSDLVNEDAINSRKMLIKINSYLRNKSLMEYIKKNMVFKGVSSSVASQLRDRLKLKVE